MRQILIQDVRWHDVSIGLYIGVTPQNLNVSNRRDLLRPSLENAALTRLRAFLQT